MMMNDVKTEVIQLIARLFKGKDFDLDILEYINLIADIGMDSITFIWIVIAIETKFNITIPDEKLLMDNFERIEDIVTIIEQELTKQSTEIRR